MNFRERTQSSDFRNKHHSLLRVRLVNTILLALIAASLDHFEFLQNIELILGVIVVDLLVNFLTRLLLRLERFEWLAFFTGIFLDVLLLTILVVSAENRTPLVALYILYVLAIGLFFGFRTSLFPSFLGIIFFVLGSIALTPGSPALYINLQALLLDTAWLVLLLVSVSLISVHSARAVSEKEKTLTNREQELAAMQNISAATRKMLPLEGLVRLVLTELIYGLRFDFGFLLLLDSGKETIRIYHTHTGKNDDLIDELLGFPLATVSLPTSAVANSFFRALRRKRTALHFRLSELTVGMHPAIPADKAQEFQEKSGLKIFVGVPMIANRQVIGGIVAATRLDDLPKEQIVSLQKFANQAGLAIESAQRFDEIERKNIALEKANRAKSDFLATMSHELRTPLTAIIGFSELLLQDFMGAMSMEQKDSIKEILNNAENLLVLINRILEFERVEAGKSRLELEEFHLRTTIEGVERSTHSLITQKSLTLNVEVEKDIPPMIADERKTRQVLLNLLSNAIKFTKKNGLITLKAQYFPGDQADDVEPRVEISVEDTGIGIQEKDLDLVFEAFQQVDSTTTREYEGTGLGLALSKRFVELQGGKIWVKSKFGEGTCFSFSLPLHVQTEQKDA